MLRGRFLRIMRNAQRSRRRTIVLAALIFALQVLPLVDSQARAETRIALVIGNSTYKNVEHLSNPINDAEDMAQALQRTGFTVTKLEDADYTGFRNAVLEFKKSAQTADMAVIYFAGHGVEIDGENWLLPVDVELRSDIDAASEALGLRWVMHAVETAKTLGLVILDSCRNNPFKIAMKRAKASRAVEVGLGPVDTTDNVLVVYASRHGTVAFDGDGRNSPFTASLLRHVETPGLEVDFLFRNVRDDVIAATEKMQQPVVYGSLSSDEIYLVPPTGEPAVASSEQLDAVEVAWSFLKETDDVASLLQFNDRFRGNRYSSDAKARIAWLQSNPKGQDGRNSNLKLASAESEPATEEKITARRFRRDTPAVKEAWDLVRSTKDERIIRKFADQFPSRERRMTANNRLADLGRQPVTFNVQPLPAAINESPEQIQQMLIGRASTDPDVLSCLGSGGQNSCGRALVKYPALGEFLNRDNFTTSVCQSLGRPLGECQGFIATNPTLVSMRPGAAGQSAAVGAQTGPSTATPTAGAGGNALSSGTAPSAPAVAQTPAAQAAIAAPAPSGPTGPTAGKGAEHIRVQSHTPGMAKLGPGTENPKADSGTGTAKLTAEGSKPTSGKETIKPAAGIKVTSRTHTGGGSARTNRMAATATSRSHSPVSSRVAVPTASRASRLSSTAAGGVGAATAARAVSTAASGAAGRAASTAASNAAGRAASNAASNAAGRAASRAASHAASRAAATAASNAASAAASRVRVPGR